MKFLFLDQPMLLFSIFWFRLRDRASMINNCLLTRGTLALIPLDVNQTTQELRKNDMGYFEGTVTSKTPKDVLGFVNTQA
jgi:Na+(H+)/acetate symporter ActP